VLKVLHVISSPSGGGAEVLVRELGARLGDFEIDNEVYYFNSTNPSTVLNDNETVLNVSTRNLSNIFKLRKLFKQKIKEHDELIIHSHLTWPFFFTALASLGLNVCLMHTEHNTYNRRRKIPFFKYIERWFYRRYSTIICISEGVYDALFKWVGKSLTCRLVVINNGARIYSFILRNNKLDIIKFVSIGSLSDKKNFSTTIKALAKLNSVDWEYSIIGEGPERNVLEKLIIDLGVQNRVRLVGWTDQIEKQLHNADIQLIPSLWEGFGLVAVEGMSTGLPVVASNVDGLREVLDEQNPAVFFVDKTISEQEWLKKINNCISSLSTNRKHMAQASRKQAEKFSLNIMVHDYAEKYKNICRK
jgi:glycosyltransferase involved in cell wall biosynthesis